MSILFYNEQLSNDPQQSLHEAVVDHRTAAIIEHRTVYKCYEQYREHLLWEPFKAGRPPGGQKCGFHFWASRPTQILFQIATTIARSSLALLPLPCCYRPSVHWFHFLLPCMLSSHPPVGRCPPKFHFGDSACKSANQKQ